MGFNVPPGPCPSCGKSLRMGQSTCLACGFDRLSGVNVREKVRRPIWGYVFLTPIGFMLTSCLAAWFLAWLVHGNPALTRAYFVVGASVVLVCAYFVVRAIDTHPPSMYEIWNDWLRWRYMKNLFTGDLGAVGMQSLVVISLVIIGCGVWLETGLPDSERVIGPAVGIETRDSPE